MMLDLVSNITLLAEMSFENRFRNLSDHATDIADRS